MTDQRIRCPLRRSNTHAHTATTWVRTQRCSCGQRGAQIELPWPPHTIADKLEKRPLASTQTRDQAMIVYNGTGLAVLRVQHHVCQSTWVHIWCLECIICESSTNSCVAAHQTAKSIDTC